MIAMRGGLAVLGHAGVLAAVLLTPVPIRGGIEPLQTAVIKSSTGLCRPDATCHADRAGVWIPSTKIGIVSVSIPEQVDVDLYVDIEVSTRPEMYMCGAGAPENAAGCIFRAKYVGPGLFDYGATSGNTYLGSNVTATNITFPAGYGIVVEGGAAVYVHLDVKNESLIDMKVDQDVWIYYVPVK